MSKREKPKTNKTRNDERRNGKAFGSGKTSPVALTDLQRVLLGKGMAHKQFVPKMTVKSKKK